MIDVVLPCLVQCSIYNKQHKGGSVLYRHGPILGENYYDIFLWDWEYTRMLKMYWYK